MISIIDGKKTYIVSVMGAALGLLQACGVAIPPWAYVLLAGIGGICLRSGIRKSETAKDRK